MSELKPCPFCGNNIIKTYNVGGNWGCACSACDGKTSFSDSEEQAITAWNTRPTPGDVDGMIDKIIDAAFMVAESDHLHTPEPSRKYWKSELEIRKQALLSAVKGGE